MLSLELLQGLVLEPPLKISLPVVPMYTVAELETLRTVGRNEEGNDMFSDYCPPSLSCSF